MVQYSHLVNSPQDTAAQTWPRHIFQYPGHRGNFHDVLMGRLPVDQGMCSQSSSPSLGITRRFEEECTLDMSLPSCDGREIVSYLGA